MKVLASGVGLVLTCSLLGCAQLEFKGEGEGGGLTYYEPKPYLFVATTKDCVTTATVVALPGARKTLKFSSGYGSADLSASLSNGMLTAVGQKTDTKIPETIGAVAGLAKALTGARVEGQCTPKAMLYPVVDGVPDKTKAIDLLADK